MKREKGLGIGNKELRDLRNLGDIRDLRDIMY